MHVTTTTARVAATVLALGALVLLVKEAAAVDPRVRSACASDYLAYCSQHDPDSGAARRCMRSHGPSLSNDCLNALIVAGEVTKEEVARRERRK